MKTVTSENRIYFLYARKSSESEDRQVQSIDDQIGRLRALAVTQGMEIKEVLIESKTAKMPYCRPVFAEMIRRIEKGEANGILCWEMNRLFRNPVDQGTIHWLLQQSVIKSIQTIEREYLPDDNVLLLNVIGGMANQYIIDLRRNCRRGMEGKAERGWCPSMPPLGYINDLADKTIKPDLKRFDSVRMIWDMMLSGKYTPKQIRNIANDKWGFRTPKHKRIGGNELSFCLIYKLLNNIFYTGMFEWSGKLYQGKHKPMVTFAEYDQVQNMLGRKGRPRAQHHVFSFTGLIQCATCGCMITASEKKKIIKSTGQYKSYVYYHCSRKNKTIKCHSQPLNLLDLEKQFEDKLEMYQIAPDFLELGLSLLREEKGKSVTDTVVIGFMQQKSLDEAQKELDTLTRMRYRELIDDAAFIKERDILKNKITRLNAEIRLSKDNSQEWIELAGKALNFAAYAQNHFKNGSTGAQKEICASLGSNYKLKDKELIFEASVWLIPIQKAYPELIAEYQRLELQKNLDAEAWNANLASIILRWRATVYDVRTAIQTLNNSDLYIPNFTSEIVMEQPNESIRE
jgi:site-specific DNA recombinase